MRQEVRLLAASVVVGFGLSAIASAGPPGPISTAATAQSVGPLSRYLYKNDDGAFELEVGGTGAAKYRWKDGRAYIDVMKFVREATFYTDEESHRGWIYECSGAGSTWYLFFGAATMGKDEHNEDLYPLYFSQEEPAKNKFDRWRTRSGTTRIALPSGVQATELRRLDTATKPIAR